MTEFFSPRTFGTNGHLDSRDPFPERDPSPPPQAFFLHLPFVISGAG